MKVSVKFGDWEPGEVIKSKIDEIKKAGKYEALESYLEDIYGEQVIDEDTLEEIILYDFDTICDNLGIEPWGDEEIEESYEFKSELLRSISERVDKMVADMEESYEDGESLTLDLMFLEEEEDGTQKYQLNGHVFYKAAEEDLDNAIDVCIEEDIFPELLAADEDLYSYTIEQIDYDESETDGTVTIVLEK